MRVIIPDRRSAPNFTQTIKNAPSKSGHQRNSVCTTATGALPTTSLQWRRKNQLINWFRVVDYHAATSLDTNLQNTWPESRRSGATHAMHQDLPRRRRPCYSRRRSVCCSPFLYINTGLDPYVSSSDSSLQPQCFSAPTTAAAATTTPHNSFTRSY